MSKHVLPAAIVASLLVWAIGAAAFVRGASSFCGSAHFTCVSISMR
jgi:hypothetical protein